MKLCKDCRHFRGDWVLIFPFVPGFWHEYAKCAAIQNPIDGKPGHYCRTMRNYVTQCGWEGKLFEPRPSVIAFFKRSPPPLTAEGE